LSNGLGGTELWIWTLTLTGGVTMLIGAVWAVRQTDLKLMLAYTTVSGLGSLVMFLGSDAPVAVVAASTFLIVHAFYKAALFLLVGILDKQAGTREIEALGGLGRAMPVAWGVALLAGFSMAGFPPLLGFIGKELKYEGALAVASEPLFVAGIAVVSNALMVVVGVIMAVGPFIGRHRAAKPVVAEAPWPMLAGPVLLAVAGLAFGLSPGLIERQLVQPMALAIIGGPVRVELKLWHGLNVPLLLSSLTFGLGLAAWRLLPWLRAALVWVEPRVPAFEGGYTAWLAGLKAGAAATARTVQPGRLSLYLRLSLGSLACLLLAASWLGGGRGPVAWPTVSVLEAGVLLVIATGALALPVARSRLGAVGALGLVGAGVAMVFALYGAVDVAMTQLLVETLLVVIIAIALLRLPVPRPAHRGGLGAVAIAAGVGLGVTLAMLAVLATPLDPSLTAFFEQASWPQGFGRNIVNVILVDFRALDTFGEIVVVAVAGIAVLAVLAGRWRNAG
jgi:multicomponent Na+:H+ antiporter subunit A